MYVYSVLGKTSMLPGEEYKTDDGIIRNRGDSIAVSGDGVLTIEVSLNTFRIYQQSNKELNDLKCLLRGFVS